MPPLHGPVMVANCVEVVQVVLRISAHPIRPPPWRPVGGKTPAALASLHHVWGHVHACEWKPHHVLHLNAAISILRQGVDERYPDIFGNKTINSSIQTCLYLSEALEVKNEDVWQSPKTQFDAALLKLLTVGTSPCIIGSQLEMMSNLK